MGMRSGVGGNRVKWVRFASLLMILTWVGCERVRELWPGQRPNVLIITLDTTRADHLGCYGYKNIETPTLDRLAAEGVRFEKVYAAAPITLPSHASILTGAYPIYHGARNNGTYQVDPSITTAAEIFKSKGYHTAAFIASFPLLSKFGLNQGFDLYDDRIEEGKEKHKFLFQERRAEDVNKAVFHWLDHRPQGPFFMWVHYFDPHFSYDPPAPFKLQYFYHPYDGEIAYVDSQIGKLLGALQEQKLLDNTIVAITADHGESLGEHKENTHAMLIYYGTIQVPLIIWAPKRITPKTVVTDMVRSIDILPTLLAYAGIKAPSEIQGASLRPLIEDRTKTLNLVAYTETLAPFLHFHWSPLEGVRTAQYSYIKANPEEEELYDVTQDRKEAKDLSAEQPKKVAELRQVLEQVKKASENPKPLKSDLQMDQQTMERLAALGYVFGTTKPPQPGEKLKNPRYAVEILETYFKGKSAEARGDADRGMDIFNALLKQDPDFGQAYLERGIIYTERKDCDQALKNFDRAEALVGQDPQISFSRYQCYLERRDFEHAEQSLYQTIKLDPSNSLAYVALYRLKMTEKKVPEAIQLLVKAVGANPKSEVAHFELAKLYRFQGKFIEAKNEFLQAQNSNPDFAPASYELGKLQYETGEKEPAVATLEECLRRDPKFVPAHALLGQIFLDEDAPQKAQAHIDVALAFGADSAYAHFTHGNLLVKQSKFEEAFAEFQKAVELDPNHALAHKNLGALSAIHGDAKRAIKEYQLSLKLLPNQPQAEKLKAAIEDLKKNGAPVPPAKKGKHAPAAAK
jgi:arylsulfatase A-like enzyme/Tfp pilus assembly protein PilF